jgi:hypothetical protein
MECRDIILNRINEIKAKENGFKKGSMRWDNFSTGTDKGHISEIDFGELDDISLVFLFERIIKRYYTQM